MGTVNVTGFQRARRMEAQRKENQRRLDKAVNDYANDSPGVEVAKVDTNIPKDSKEALEVKNEVLAHDELTIEQVKSLLDEHEVKYAHNTSEKKLREKLADVNK